MKKSELRILRLFLYVLTIFRAFGWEPTEFAHLPLIMNSDGTKLSKLQTDLHLSALRERAHCVVGIKFIF